MIHVGDISADKRLNHPQEELKIGQSGARGRARSGRTAPAHPAGHEATGAHRGRRIHRRAQGRRDGDRPRDGREPQPRQRGVGRRRPGDVYSSRNVPKPKEKSKPQAQQQRPAVDLSALSSMLTSRWKGGGEATGFRRKHVASEPPKPASVRAGQVRTFRITKLDPEKKRIDLELARSVAKFVLGQRISIPAEQRRAIPSDRACHRFQQPPASTSFRSSWPVKERRIDCRPSRAPTRLNSGHMNNV